MLPVLTLDAPTLRKNTFFECFLNPYLIFKALYLLTKLRLEHMRVFFLQKYKKVFFHRVGISRVKTDKIFRIYAFKYICKKNILTRVA